MQSAAIRKAIVGASIGNAVEWFDFAIYGFLATYLGANFFPTGNDTAALLNTFAIFRGVLHASARWVRLRSAR
jgi:MHS family proline/betaine transporter-like MFS transporter